MLPSRRGAVGGTSLAFSKGGEGEKNPYSFPTMIAFMEGSLPGTSVEGVVRCLSSGGFTLGVEELLRRVPVVDRRRSTRATGDLKESWARGGRGLGDGSGVTRKRAGQTK